jgi:hypothetical protein
MPLVWVQATQVLTGLVGALILGEPNEFENALLMGAAWVINLAVAEWSHSQGFTQSGFAQHRFGY